MENISRHDHITRTQNVMEVSKSEQYGWNHVSNDCSTRVSLDRFARPECSFTQWHMTLRGVRRILVCHFSLAPSCRDETDSDTVMISSGDDYHSQVPLVPLGFQTHALVVFAVSPRGGALLVWAMVLWIRIHDEWSVLFVFLYFLHFVVPMGINSGSFPQGKPAATESRYPTLAN